MTRLAQRTFAGQAGEGKKQSTYFAMADHVRLKSKTSPFAA
jgi:hypothetical protein